MPSRGNSRIFGTRTPGQTAEPFGIAASAGDAHGIRLVHDRRGAFRHDGLRPRQGPAAKIGLADGIQDQPVPWQSCRLVEEFGDQHDRLEDVLIDDRLIGEIAVARRNQHQQGHRLGRTAIRQHGHRPIAKGEPAMPLGRWLVADGRR